MGPTLLVRRMPLMLTWEGRWHEPHTLLVRRGVRAPGKSHRSCWQSLGRTLGFLQSCAPSSRTSWQDIPALTWLCERIPLMSALQETPQIICLFAHCICKEIETLSSKGLRRCAERGSDTVLKPGSGPPAHCWLVPPSPTWKTASPGTSGHPVHVMLTTAYLAQTLSTFQSAFTDSMPFHPCCAPPFPARERRLTRAVMGAHS